MFLDSMFGDTPVLECPTEGLTRDEWLAIRTSEGRIGGSDIGVVMGWSKYKSPIRLFREKIGMIESSFDMNDAAFGGTVDEQTIKDCYWKPWDEIPEMRWSNYYRQSFPRDYRDRGMMKLYEDDWALLNIDGEIIKHPTESSVGILEAKAMGGIAYDMWVDKGWGGLDPSYIFQVQGYMLKLGATYGEIIVRVDGRWPHLYYLEPKDNIQSALEEKCWDFYERMKKGKEILASTKSEQKREQFISEIQPDIDDSDDTRKVLSEASNVIGDRREIEVGDDFYEWMLAYDKHHQEAKAASDLKRLQQNKMIDYMNKEGADKAVHPNGYVSFKSKFSMKLF